jgi:hypothetical protein
MQQLQQFLRGRRGEPWCKECLERELGRRIHSAPTQLEGHRGFRRQDAPCVMCGKTRLILQYTAEQ